MVPWAKAGIIVKASLTAGSPYAAIIVTGKHGIRMQDDFTGDVAGPASSWLRLVRNGATITGYASSDGVRWTRVAAVTVPGLSGRVQAGLFVTSPQYTADLDGGRVDQRQPEPVDGGVQRGFTVAAVGFGRIVGGDERRGVVSRGARHRVLAGRR